MARIQVLPLPAEELGEVRRTPYIVIVDKLENGDFDLLAKLVVDDLADRLGAKQVLVYDGELTVVDKGV